MKKIFPVLLLLAILLLCTSCDQSDTPSGSPLDSSSQGSESTDVPSDSSSQDSGTDELEPCSHVYSSSCDPFCDKCGEQRSDIAAHSFDSDSECENKQCTVCGYLLEQSHDYVYVSGKEATLMAKGNKTEVCSRCQDKLYTVLPIVTPESLGMPAVYITDYSAKKSVANLQKSDGEILVKYKYESNDSNIKSFECFSKLKIQGSYSANYPKKNFTVKFFEDEGLTKKLKVDLGWGKESKYCMKANYIDSSQARNIVGARLSASVVATRKNIPEGLMAAPNYGLIDGYPVLVYLNGSFYGLYTMNIPKDDWQFAMNGEEDTREAIVMASDWNDYCMLRKTLGPGDPAQYGLEIEHCSTADTSWVTASFNEMIQLLNCGDGNRIRRELPKHLDIEAAIDNFILTYAMNAGDNQSKNILWVTYDGVKWIPSMYDMDSTFGLWWDGSPMGMNGAVHVYPTASGNGSYSLPGNASQHFHVLIKYYSQELEARWLELRKDILSSGNINQLFYDFSDLIPSIVFESERIRWKDIPYASKNSSSMYSLTKVQLGYLDEFFKNLN